MTRTRRTSPVVCLAALALLVLPLRADDDLPAQIDALMESRHWAEARPLAEKWLAALEKAATPAEPLALAQARHVLGSVQDRLGDHEAALATLSAAAAAYEKAGAEPTFRAACEEEAARAAQAAGKYADAEKWLRAALGRRPAPEAAATEAQFVELLVKIGRFDEAASLLRGAKPTSDDAAGRFLLARAAGVLSHSTGRFDEAISRFRQARADAGALGDEAPALRAAIDAQIGQSLFRLGRPAEAVRALEAAYSFFSKQPDGSAEALAALNNLAAVWLATGQAALAVERLEKAAPLAEPVARPEMITLWLNLGAAALKTGKRDLARTALERARALAGEFLPEVHLLRAQIAATAQALALKEGDAASARREGLTASGQATRWMQRLREWGSEEEWLEFRRTLDPVSPLATVGTAETDALLRTVLATQGVALDSLLRRRAGRSGAEVAPVSPESLPPDAVLVNYVWWRPVTFDEAAPRYGALVVKRGAAAQWIDLGPAETIETRLRRIIATARDTVAANGPVKDRAALDFQLGQLRELVWDKITPHAPADAQLLLRADGMLQFVPWAVLREGGRFFCETHRRVTVLGQARKLPSEEKLGQGWRVLAVTKAPVGGEALFTGDPPAPLTPELWHDLREMPNLPGTRAEADAIAAAAGKIACEMPEPVEAAFRTVPAPRVLHFCGHGFASEQDSLSGAPLLRAGLVLADCGPALRDLAAGKPRPAAADGLLFSTDAAALDLSATELVFLSGCQTGLGQWQPGEHLAGLRHAFFVAGARHVGSTLWDLNDAVAPELVRGFYEKLAAGESPPDAMWAAQREWLAREAARPVALRAALAGPWTVESAGW